LTLNRDASATEPVPKASATGQDERLPIQKYIPLKFANEYTLQRILCNLIYHKAHTSDMTDRL
jgi:hypothetical protein